MEQKSNSFFGKIQIQNIVNLPVKGHTSLREFTSSHYKTVQYPDCQQLIIWLPEPSKKYEDILIHNLSDNKIIWQDKVENVLSGSVKIIIDSLFIPPGEYELFITMEGQKSLSLFFEKWEEGFEPVIDPSIPEEASDETEKPPIEYRDGFGNILPNEDLVLREVAFEKLKDQFISKIKYFSVGRDGYLIFTEGEKSARFEMEMGGGDCMFFIILPDKRQWEKATGFPLSERERIVDHIAHMTYRDQVGGAKYTINEKEITYYRN